MNEIIKSNQKPVINWTKIRDDYIMGWYQEVEKCYYYPTINEIAEKFRVSEAAVRKRSKTEAWNKIREILKAKIKEKKTIEDVKTIITLVSSFDARSLECMDSIYKTSNSFLQKLKDYVEHIDFVDEEDLSNFINKSAVADNILKITNALVKVNDLNKKILSEEGSKKNFQQELETITTEIRNYVNVTEDTYKETKLNDLENRLKSIKQTRRTLLSNTAGEILEGDED
jgi:hypothetical protein